MDATFDFEKKRNVPMKYSRELWQKTVEAIKKVEAIKSRRQAQFIRNRLKAGLKLRDEAEKQEVEKGVHLLEDTSGIAEKAKAAQRQRLAAKKRDKEVAEMETDE